MKRPPHGHRRGDCLSPTDPKFLSQPLDFIAEDHLREREMCTLIDKIAGATGLMQEDARTVLRFLREELPRHLLDEEEDLFPLMRRRCDPDDEIDKVIERLHSDHGSASAHSPFIMALLERVIERGETLSEDDRAALKVYASRARRHLILENAIILPIARLRLTAEDLDTLRLRMMQRRGLDRLAGDGHAQ